MSPESLSPERNSLSYPIYKIIRWEMLLILRRSNITRWQRPKNVLGICTYYLRAINNLHVFLCFWSWGENDFYFIVAIFSISSFILNINNYGLLSFGFVCTGWFSEFREHGKTKNLNWYSQKSICCYLSGKKLSECWSPLARKKNFSGRVDSDKKGVEGMDKFFGEEFILASRNGG